MKKIKWSDLTDDERFTLDLLYTDAILAFVEEEEHWLAIQAFGRLEEFQLIEQVDKPKMHEAYRSKIYRLTKSGLKLAHKQRLEYFFEHIYQDAEAQGDN